MSKFDDLIKRAAGFVDRQQGRWDNAEWLGFLSDIRQKGVELSKEMEDGLGLVLESMKRFYGTPNGQQGSGLSDALKNVSDQVTRFVSSTKGAWDHAGWESFVKEIQSAGVKLSSETTAHVGEILEASKRIYQSLPGKKKADGPIKATRTASKKAAGAKKAAEPKKEQTPKKQPVAAATASVAAAKPAEKTAAPLKATASNPGKSANSSAANSSKKAEAAPKSAAKSPAIKPTKSSAGKSAANGSKKRKKSK